MLDLLNMLLSRFPWYRRLRGGRWNRLVKEANSEYSLTYWLQREPEDGEVLILYEEYDQDIIRPSLRKVPQLEKIQEVNRNSIESLKRQLESFSTQLTRIKAERDQVAENAKTLSATLVETQEAINLFENAKNQALLERSLTLAILSRILIADCQITLFKNPMYWTGISVCLGLGTFCLDLPPSHLEFFDFLEIIEEDLEPSSHRMDSKKWDQLLNCAKIASDRRQRQRDLINRIRVTQNSQDWQDLLSIWSNNS